LREEEEIRRNATNFNRNLAKAAKGGCAANPKNCKPPKGVATQKKVGRHVFPSKTILPKDIWPDVTKLFFVRNLPILVLARPGPNVIKIFKDVIYEFLH
jgi:hypothetical protein